MTQPFSEDALCGPNEIWGSYGTDKLAAEKYLLDHVPQAYVLRSPYLYGPMQNVYREPFVFDCAIEERPFFIPKDGSMPLQFFHVEDLCRFINIILKQQPKNHIFNVGNEDVVSITQWVELCYQVTKTSLKKIYVDENHSQRDYFPFYDYNFYLDISRQKELMPDTKPILLGLQESYDWYIRHTEEVRKKPFFNYIDTVLAEKGMRD